MTLSFKNTIKTLHNILVSKNEKHRTILGFSLIGIELFTYASWAWCVYLLPQLHHFVNIDFLQEILPYTIMSFLIPISGVAITYSLNNNNVKGLVSLQILVLSIYSIFIGVLAHIIGELSLLTGIAITISPVLCLLLFKRHVAYIIFYVSLIIFFTMLFLINIGLVQDAPLLNEQTLKPSTFWILSLIHFAVGKIWLIFFIIDLLLHKLKNDDEEIQFLSEHDELTKVYNRKTILHHIQEFFVEPDIKNNKKKSCVVILDIDDFKKVNDVYGHNIGDEVLYQVAQTLQDSVRNTDSVGRYGGEEFIIFLKDCPLHDGLLISESIRQKITDLSIDDGQGGKLQVSASFGVASSVPLMMNQEKQQNNKQVSLDYSLIDLADQAMYNSKVTGKDRVSTLQKLENDMLVE